MSHKPWGLSTKSISHKDSAGQYEQDGGPIYACTHTHTHTSTHTVWPVWLVFKLLSLNISSTVGAARGRLALAASRIKRLLWGRRRWTRRRWVRRWVRIKRWKKHRGVILNITYTYGTVFTHFQFNQYLPQPSQTISGTFPNQSPSLHPPKKKICKLRLRQHHQHPVREHDSQGSPPFIAVSDLDRMNINSLPAESLPWDSPRVETGAQELNSEKKRKRKDYWGARKYACIGIYLLTKSYVWDVGHLMSVWSPPAFWAWSGTWAGCTPCFSYTPHLPSLLVLKAQNPEQIHLLGFRTTVSTGQHRKGDYTLWPLTYCMSGRKVNMQHQRKGWPAWSPCYKDFRPREERKRNNRVKVGEGHGLVFFEPPLGCSAMPDPFSEKSQIKSEISQLSSNVFHSFL